MASSRAPGREFADASRSSFREGSRMKSRALVLVALVSGSLLAGVCNLAGQGVAEIRLADTRYRFADVSFTAKNGAVLDAFYVGVPGSNELNAGGGYTFKRNALTLTPLVYAVVGKEGGERGIKTALLTAYESDGWKFAAFLGAFVRTAGSTDSYQVL